MTEYREAIVSNPSSVNAHLSFGTALLAEGRYEDAIEQFRSAVDLDRQNVAAHFDLGSALYQWAEALPARQLTRKDERRIAAIDAFDQVVKLAPHFGDAYYNRGLVLRRMGERDEANAAADKDFKEAKSQYELTVRHDPNHPNARRKLGVQLYSYSGDHEGGIRKFSDAIKIDDAFTEAYRSRGLAWFYMGKFNNAVPDLKIVAYRRPDNIYSMLWLYLAEAHRLSDNANAWATAWSDLEQRARATGVPKRGWPYAAVELFLDNKTPKETLLKKTLEAAGENADHQCEAHFYIGEWLQLHKSDGEAAKEELMTARESCRMEFIEYQGAAAELERLRTSQNGTRRIDSANDP